MNIPTKHEPARQSDARAGLRLHCRGLVQGVGFRPAVARLAAALGLEGCLTNVTAGVSIELAGERPALERFLKQLPASLPPAARLEPLIPDWLLPPLPAALAAGRGLRLTAAPPLPLGVGLVAPSLVADRAPCRACLRELRDPTDRRHGYPFISCCSCGPRYSIASAEPFCRAHTTLAAFALCPACQAEFDDPGDRRFHAETIGCPACGPQLRLLDGQGRHLAGRPRSEDRGTDANAAMATADLLRGAVALLRRGGILGLQGVGGFQLLVDASDAAAVARLRQRKRRPHKPFALLVDRPERLLDLVEPSPAELAALNDPAAPIVLLASAAADHAAGLAGVAPGAPALGVMLPASPLHLLLAEAFAGPLVATSGNRSGEPLCINPDEALERLAGLADAFLVHDRPIARPLDDSVLQLIDGRPSLLRRARGYAPEVLPLPQPVGIAFDADRRSSAQAPLSQPDAPCQPSSTSGGTLPGPAARPEHASIPLAGAEEAAPAAGACGTTADPTAPLLALGSDLRSAPALAVGDQLWLAPHLGDLADSRCLERWREGLAELLERQGGAVQTVGLDAHPEYLSHQLGSALLHSGPPEQTALHDPPAAQRPALQLVAHHRAHGLAVVAEHGLALPLPALVLDGLGYGGGPVPLWGCELLRLEPGGARRLASLRPFPLPGGERAVREPRRSALGLLWAAGLLDHPGAAALRAAFGPGEIQLLSQAMAAGCNSPWCSSAGRLFDAVASLLDLVQIASHDSQAGLLLQAMAAEGIRMQVTAGVVAYPLTWHSRGGSPNLTTTATLGAASAGAPRADPSVSWVTGATKEELTLAAVRAMGQPAGLTPKPGTRAETKRPVLPRLDWQPLLSALLNDLASGCSQEMCAYRFHAGLAQGLAAAVAELGWPSRTVPCERPVPRSGPLPSCSPGGTAADLIASGRTARRTITQTDAETKDQAVVLAGGCLQNRLLLEGLIAALRQRGLRPFWGERIPLNDGGLAAGQIQALRQTPAVRTERD